MIDMKYTAAEAKEEMAETVQGPMAGEYPWGLSISLEKDQFDKLGIALPNVGDEIYFTAMAKVTSVNSNATEDREDARAGIQICMMQVDSVEPAAEEKAEGKETPAKEARESKTIMYS
jgi:hypothetical protein